MWKLKCRGKTKVVTSDESSMPAFQPLIPVGYPGGRKLRLSPSGLLEECCRKQVWNFVLVITLPPNSHAIVYLAWGLPLTPLCDLAQLLLLSWVCFLIDEV